MKSNLKPRCSLTIIYFPTDFSNDKMQLPLLPPNKHTLKRNCSRIQSHLIHSLYIHEKGVGVVVGSKMVI